jgi:hypothetical protein
MAYKLAKLKGEALRNLSSRIGRHADQWSGLIGIDGTNAIARDGSRRQFSPADVTFADGFEIEEGGASPAIVTARFAEGGSIRTWAPYWL